LFGDTNPSPRSVAYITPENRRTLHFFNAGFFRRACGYMDLRSLRFTTSPSPPAWWLRLPRSVSGSGRAGYLSQHKHLALTTYCFCSALVNRPTS